MGQTEKNSVRANVFRSFPKADVLAEAHGDVHSKSYIMRIRVDLTLDFAWLRSGTVPIKRENNVDHAIAEKAITIILTEIHLRLDEAARIAKAAEACALAGSITEGVMVSTDIEQIIYEAGRLHDAASLLNRLSQG
jgi:hypothetical protein